MDFPKTHLQTGFHYGAFYGLAAFLFCLMLYYTIGNPLGPLSWLGCWITVVFICIAIKNHRNNHLNGYINYWEAFKTGLFTVIFGGGLYALLMFLFGTVIVPDILADYKTEMMEEADKMRELSFFSEKIIDAMIEGIEKTTMGSVVFVDYFYKVMGGALVSFVAAAVYKKTKMPDDVLN